MEYPLSANPSRIRAAGPSHSSRGQSPPVGAAIRFSRPGRAYQFGPALAGRREIGGNVPGASLRSAPVYDGSGLRPGTAIALAILTLAIQSCFSPWAAENSESAHTVVAPGAKLEKLSGTFEFTEGPTTDKAGTVYFTDQPNNRIMKWSTDGQLSTFKQPAGRANGMYFDPKGNLLACADEKTELWSIAPDGKVTVLVNEYQGKKLNGPNDVWAHPKGGIYFTDPFYKRPWWDWEKLPQDGQHVYYLSPDGKLTRVTHDLVQPNGIIGTPDGKHLYVADIGDHKTYRFDIEPDRTLSHKTLFCQLGSDGMTMDSKGNVYLTGQGVTVFDRTGKQIDHIAVAEPWTANVSFGGKDRHTLFITASKGLYSIRLKVKGAALSK